MTIYELNQIVMAQKEPLTGQELEAFKATVDEYQLNHPDNYYMVLSHDINYYTVFAVEDGATEAMSDVLVECLQNAGNGEILSVVPEGEALELWFNISADAEDDQGNKITKRPVCAYLFRYSCGVVAVKG